MLPPRAKRKIGGRKDTGPRSEPETALADGATHIIATAERQDGQIQGTMRVSANGLVVVQCHVKHSNGPPDVQKAITPTNLTALCAVCKGGLRYRKTVDPQRSDNPYIIIEALPTGSQRAALQGWMAPSLSHMSGHRHGTLLKAFMLTAILTSSNRMGHIKGRTRSHIVLQKGPK